MTGHRNLHVVGILIAGVFLGFILARGDHARLPSAYAAENASKPPSHPTKAGEPANEEEESLPDQSHVMIDVATQFSNLWFAAQKGNWPLADFFHEETGEHLAWAVKIMPKRKDKAGREIDLAAILQAIQTSPYKQLAVAIKAKDKVAFEKAYRFMIEGCYSCHKAVDKPYLKLQIPTVPALPNVNFDPAADWPR